MKVRDLNSLQNIIQEWDGDIVVDAYNVDGPSAVAVLSLMKGNKIAKSIKFEGDNYELTLLFTEVLRKNINKVVKEQRKRIVTFSDI